MFKAGEKTIEDGVVGDAKHPILGPNDQVFVTDSGEKFHRPGCPYLKGSASPILKKEAEAKGYSACSVCKP